MDFDTTKYKLGNLCKKGHDYNGTGMSLRLLRWNYCIECWKSNAKRHYTKHREEILVKAKKVRKLEQKPPKLKFSQEILIVQGIDSSKYRVGKLCKKNHEFLNTGGSLRYSSGRCLECHREWYKNNLERQKNLKHSWYKRNKNKYQAFYKRHKEEIIQYQKTNWERTKEIARNWYHSNKGKVKEYWKRWYELNREGELQKARDNYQKRKQEDPFFKTFDSIQAYSRQVKIDKLIETYLDLYGGQLGILLIPELAFMKIPEFIMTLTEEKEKYLRQLYKIMKLLCKFEDKHTARAWMIDMKSNFNDRMPLELLQEGKTKEVWAGVKAYIRRGN